MQGGKASCERPAAVVAAMESAEIRTAEGNRYTVFSLWDTYRNLHQLMTLLIVLRPHGRQLQGNITVTGVFPVDQT